MKSLLKPGDILRRFVRDAGNGISVIKQLLRFAGVRGVLPLGQKADRTDASFFLAGAGVSGTRRAAVIDNLQYLALDDPPNPVEVSATLIFEIVGSGRLAAKPKYDEYSREDGKTSRRKQIIPVA